MADNADPRPENEFRLNPFDEVTKDPDYADFSMYGGVSFQNDHSTDMGPRTSTFNCGQDEAIYGIKIEYGDNIIDRIEFKCRDVPG